jgi:hypothetical protein
LREDLICQHLYPGDLVKSIQVDSQVFDHLKAHGMGAGESASDVLRSLLLHTIEIDDELYAYLISLASVPGETPNGILRRELDIGEGPAQPPAVIEFHIPAGTGSNPWNMRDTAVTGVVGRLCAFTTTTPSPIACILPALRSRMPPAIRFPARSQTSF